MIESAAAAAAAAVAAAAAAAVARVLEEPPSSTAFEHTGGRLKQTAELRDSHDNHQKHTVTHIHTSKESLNAAGYQD